MKTKQSRREENERERIQSIIKERYPQLIIRFTAEKCANCKHRPCHLLPITSHGETCPYFENVT